MRLARGLWTACVLACTVSTQCVSAQIATQNAAETPPQSTQDALHAMARMAGVIFAGQVIAVRRLDGVIEIDFAVDDAVRGVPGSTYTLREWAGLWAAGDQPFRVGQRYLMLLHAPGAAGLSSPVGGMDGAIPIRGSVQATSATSLSALIATQTVDLRWITTRVVQPLAYQITSVARPTALPSPVHPNTILATNFLYPSSAEGSEAAAIMRTEDVTAPAFSPNAAIAPVQQLVPYATVMTMLRGWEADDHAAR